MSEQRALQLESFVVGDGEHRVVFLHGLMGRGRNFTTIAKGLGDGYASLMLDLPNHGESPWTDSWDYNLVADRVASHLRGRFAAHGPVNVVGHSMGGKVAMLLALRHPELVERLVIIDIAPVDSSATGGTFEHLLGALLRVELDGLIDRNAAAAQLHEPIPDATMRGFLMQNLRRTPDGFAWQPNVQMLYDNLPVIAGFPDVAGQHFDGPTLWIGGGESNYIQDEYVPIMRALFPRMRRLTVKGAGHWVHSEQPQQVITALRCFFEH
ncbi:alpha/beta fold hydrolase [Gulosibacter macacae]|nr:alpha/beta fold hydrolase [Gulosibacter macacae]